MCANVVSKLAVVLPHLLLVVGCAASDDADVEEGSTGSAVIESMQDGDPTEFPEVVQVIVNNADEDYCSGVLVSPTRVLTAAHCSASTYVIKAPHAPKVNGKTPESKARKGAVVAHSSSFLDEVWKEDAAVLDLETPIALDTYPQLRDVGDLDGTVRAVAVGRSAEERLAPLVKSKPLTVRSGNEDGYTTGLTSQYYSSGGDSGGPLFLVGAGGRAQHVIIGIERQPDPPVERFTRITPAVKAIVEQ